MAFEALEAKLIELFLENALFRYSRSDWQIQPTQNYLN